MIAINRKRPRSGAIKRDRHTQRLLTQIFSIKSQSRPSLQNIAASPSLIELARMATNTHFKFLRIAAPHGFD